MEYKIHCCFIASVSYVRPVGQVQPTELYDLACGLDLGCMSCTWHGYALAPGMVWIGCQNQCEGLGLEGHRKQCMPQTIPPVLCARHMASPALRAMCSMCWPQGSLLVQQKGLAWGMCCVQHAGWTWHCTWLRESGAWAACCPFPAPLPALCNARASLGTMGTALLASCCGWTWHHRRCTSAPVQRPSSTSRSQMSLTSLLYRNL